MPAIDHLVYASPHLDEGVHRIEQFVGTRAVAGLEPGGEPKPAHTRGAGAQLAADASG